ncbi:Chitin-binding, domain 3 [Penicillium camemberti]|uniref:Chitin-binding, domain 3 n=1 Tax=Penicillium camemberti (strain FM 013) TaxID=1429867 RepID=A0A0G4PEY5_PENC3|nr:Chitin-binding, domain 3 [Penicillium camemberti]
MKNFTPALAFASIISLVNAHGFVTKPEARQPGTAMGAACGQQVLSNQGSDKYGNIQGELQVAASQSDYNAAECDIWLCKGYKFADNKDNVQSYTAGQKVPFTVDIRAPHTGVANVSVVATASNKVIGAPLISWDVYASTATGVTADETSFSVTIPDGLGSQCATAGDCVLQWYWYAESIDQTYESCVDFTVGGSGSASAASSASSASSTSSTSSATEIAVTSTPSPAVQTPTTTAAESTTAPTTAAAEPTSSSTVAAQPTTFATTARPSATSAAAQVPTSSAAPSASASALPFSTGSASDVLSWLEALLGNLVGN